MVCQNTFILCLLVLFWTCWIFLLALLFCLLYPKFGQLKSFPVGYFQILPFFPSIPTLNICRHNLLTSSASPQISLKLAQIISVLFLDLVFGFHLRLSLIMKMTMTMTMPMTMPMTMTMTMMMTMTMTISIMTKNITMTMKLIIILSKAKTRWVICILHM